MVADSFDHFHVYFITVFYILTHYRLLCLASFLFFSLEELFLARSAK